MRERQRKIEENREEKIRLRCSLTLMINDIPQDEPCPEAGPSSLDADSHKSVSLARSIEVCDSYSHNGACNTKEILVNIAHDYNYVYNQLTIASTLMNYTNTNHL